MARLSDDVCIKTRYMRRFVEPLVSFVDAQARGMGRVLHKGQEVVGHLGARGSTVFPGPKEGRKDRRIANHFSTLAGES